MSEKVIFIGSHAFLMGILGWYFITLMQWYNYKIERVIFHHKKVLWHLFYFVIPIGVYYIASPLFIFWLYFYVGLLPAFFLWHRKLDKKLVLTGRVKRFFALLLLFSSIEYVGCFYTTACGNYGVLLPLILAGLGSHLVEKILFYQYKRKGYEKLQRDENLKIVSITASFGKTSMKNILTHLLTPKYRVYATPRSVNTIGGLVKDVNTDLPENIEVYITEAGAREEGDILEISLFLEPHYAIIGKVGAQHLEYFKTLERIKDTKRELLASPRLLDAFIDESATLEGDTEQGFMVLGDEGEIKVGEVKGDLHGITFEMDVHGEHLCLYAPLLGRFNAVNIALCVACALKMGVDKETIVAQVATLHPTPHRLQRLDAGGKIILDDSFNGNYEGMMEGIALCDTYEGRRVIITPGIVESTVELNTQLGEAIDKVFDLVIITGAANSHILCDAIENSEKVRLRDKSRLQDLLAKKTRAGDLIYFANDAPNFI